MTDADEMTRDAVDSTGSSHSLAAALALALFLALPFSLSRSLSFALSLAFWLSLSLSFFTLALGFCQPEHFTVRFTCLVVGSNLAECNLT